MARTWEFWEKKFIFSRSWCSKSKLALFFISWQGIHDKIRYVKGKGSRAVRQQAIIPKVCKMWSIQYPKFYFTGWKQFPLKVVHLKSGSHVLLKWWNLTALKCRSYFAWIFLHSSHFNDVHKHQRNTQKIKILRFIYFGIR